MLLLNKNATVTICHSRTRDLPSVTRRADLLVGAVGIPKFIQADWVKEGVVLIDAGYNPGNIGDIDLQHAAPKSSAYTPIPGGVGPMTIVSLIEQTVSAAEKHL
jgi:methylenetetrahydrofolate dehydrogenase (NADP+)/methenyltetrahydrofolate cyclohydrolase